MNDGNYNDSDNEEQSSSEQLVRKHGLVVESDDEDEEEDTGDMSGMNENIGTDDADRDIADEGVQA